MNQSMLKRVAVAMIIDQQQRLLITQRATHLSHGGFWEFPGGKLEANESPEIALVREVHEEVGLEVLAFRYLGKVDYAYPTHQVILYGYIVHHYRGQAQCCESQLGLRWVKSGDLMHYEFPAANQRLIEMLSL